MNKTICILALAFLPFTACSTTGPTNAQLERKHYGEWEQSLGYTQVIRHGKTLYISGIGSAGATLRDQLNDIYRTAHTILSEYKGASSDIVKEVIYTTDIESLEKANSIRKQFYSDGQYPSSSWVQVERLLGADMQVEVEFIVQLRH